MSTPGADGGMAHLDRALDADPSDGIAIGDTVQASPAIELIGISKYYGAAQVLHEVNMAVDCGEVVGLVGDNGSGKSTLVKIIMGYHRPTFGSVRMFGQEVVLRSPAQSRGLGIEAVYQDWALIDELSLWRNFFLGREMRKSSKRGWDLDRKSMRTICAQELAKLGLMHIRSVDEQAAVLSGGEKQSLAITRAVHFGARVLILDEPTAALSVRETRNVLSVISAARERGLAVIYIDHNMEHVTPVADRVVLLEHGRVIASFRRGETTTEQLRELVAGATLGQVLNRWDADALDSSA